jgi:polyhydroxybutyrate depolymerase
VRRFLVLGLLAGVLALAPSTPADAAGTGCGIGRAPGTKVHTIDSGGGRRRSYRLSVPRGYTGDERVPLVVDLHGAGSNAVQEQLLTGAVAEAAERGWIVATPDAGAVFWLLQGRGGQDVKYLQRVVNDVSQRLCIHPRRRFVMGMSNGAGMSAAVICAAPNLFAAAAPVAGLNIGGSCAQRPIPVLAVHGTADPVVPYQGGPIHGVNGVSLSVPAVTETLRQVSIRNHCTSGPTSTPEVQAVTRIAYGGCAARTELLRVSRGGHTWPGGPDLTGRHLGPTNHTLDATDTIFDFFADTFAP